MLGHQVLPRPIGSRQTHAERLHRELQRQIPRRGLNEHWFQTLQQARETIARWRRDYNEVRPHSSIGRIPPARFANEIA